MTGTTAPYRSDGQAASDRFSHLLHAEWTKLRTVRGWVVGLVAAALVTVVLGLFTAQASHTSCGGGGPSIDPACVAPVGPDGAAVADGFYFVHQPLDGDVSITVEVTSLTGLIPSYEAPNPQDPGLAMDPGLEPWAKAGIMIKDGTDQGSAYAAIMVTGDHGVRMQHNYTHDTAGTAGAVADHPARWLRLTRSGDTLTGYESADGEQWTEVGTAHLDGLPSTVQVGLFVASPPSTQYEQRPFELSETGGPSQATAFFDHLDLQGSAQDSWRGNQVGNDPVLSALGEYQETGGTFTVSGSGDIAPATFGSDRTIEQSLVGTFAGLIGVVVVATMFITAEYRRRLIHTTLTASPHRARVLVAKAVVIGAATFVVGLVAAAVAVAVGQRIARSDGIVLNPVSTLTEVRVVAGTAALLAAAAVLAVAVGAMLRRSAAAVTAVIALIILPYILATASLLPNHVAEWLLRLTPAAAFSVQQTLVEHPQVSNLFTPAAGYFPLPPWAGLAVIGGYAGVALVVAVVLLTRRDA